MLKRRTLFATVLLIAGIALPVVAGTWDCGIKQDSGCSGCTWVNRQWPLENVCVNTVPNDYTGCISGGAADECTEEFNNPPNAEKKCSVYWNYIGQLGSAGNCSLMTSGNQCGTEDFDHQSGNPVPDGCDLTYGG